MADALTSNTGTVATLVLTQKLENIDPESGVVAYIHYTKGGETNIKVQFAFLENVVDSTNYYNDIYLDNSLNVYSKQLTLLSTGYYRIPIAIAGNEDAIKATFTVTGSAGNAAIKCDIRVVD